MSYFDLHLEICVDDDFTIDDIKEILGAFAQEHDLELEGSIIQKIGPKEVDCAYIAVEQGGNFMNDSDKQMLDMLLKDQGKRYQVVIDNDNVCVVDKEKLDEDDDPVIHDFQEFGYHLLRQVFEHLGLDADFCQGGIL